MAKPELGAQLAPAPPKFSLCDLRLAIWGVSAASALFITLYAGTTEIGRERLVVAVAEIRDVLIPSRVKPIPPLNASESFWLAETVRWLAVDRDRLLTRVAMLERSLDGIAGSIASVEQAERRAPTSSVISAVSAPPVSSTATVETKLTRSTPDEDYSYGAISAAGEPPAPPAPPVETTPTKISQDDDYSSSVSSPPVSSAPPVETTPPKSARDDDYSPSAISAASQHSVSSTAPVETKLTRSSPDEDYASSAISPANAPPASSAPPVETTPTMSARDADFFYSAISAASTPPASSAPPVETTPIRSAPDWDHTASLPVPPPQPTASFAKPESFLNLGSATTGEPLRVASPQAGSHGGGAPRSKPCALPGAVKSLDLPHYAFHLAASLLEWPRGASRCPSNTAGAQIAPGRVILTQRPAAAALGRGSLRRGVMRAAPPGQYGVAPRRQRGKARSEMARRMVGR